MTESRNPLFLLSFLHLRLDNLRIDSKEKNESVKEKETCTAGRCMYFSLFHINLLGMEVSRLDVIKLKASAQQSFNHL